MKIRYQDAQNYLKQVPSFAKKTSLNNVQCILDQLGNPEIGLSFIHVAGTNGKGSTCTFIESILRAQGKRTGLFLSPHVSRINERIRICGDDVEDDLFAICFEEVKKGVDLAVEKGGEHPSFFEFLFFMALVAFTKEQLDLCIIETGMGGRHDATNVIMPLVSVLTSISIDHTEFLGHTLKEIAHEKAGIIKPFIPVVYLEQSEIITEEVRSEIRKKNAVDQGFSEDNLKLIDFFNDCEYDKDSMIPLGLLGDFQYDNAKLAVSTVKVIDSACTDEAILTGLADARLPGRMERIAPGIYVDGAHNVSGVQVFCHTLEKNFKGRKVILYAPSHISEREPILKILHRIDGLVQVIEVPVLNRAIDDDAFLEAFRKMEQLAGEDATCFFVGSFYLAGKAKSYLEDRTDD